MKLMMILLAVSAIALLAGCAANEKCADEGACTEGQKEGCSAKDGKSCCPESAKCDDKKTEKAAPQKN